MGLYPADSNRWTNLLGIVGCCSLIGALLVAHTNPAPAYELSIYAATPVAYWVGIGLAFLVSALIAFSQRDTKYWLFGIVLGGATSLSVVSLPMIRGYRYHGIHDSVTHVGILRELVAGTMLPVDTVYPGIHSLAAFVGGVTGFSHWQSMLLVPILITAASFVFVPLVVREIVGGRTAGTVGAFSAFLLVPIHQLAATLHPHPSSQAILFAPVVFLLLIWYLRWPDTDAQSYTVYAVGITLLGVIFATIQYHPQQALNVIALLLGISVVQFVRDRVASGTGRRHRRVYSLCGLSILLYLFWVTTAPGILGGAESALYSLVDVLTGTSESPGSAVNSQSTAITAIGASLAVLVLKLFGVSILYIVAATLLIVGTMGGWLRRTETNGDTRALVLYFTVGLATMLPIFIVYFAGNVGQYYFRQASFMMLVVTILGAVGITYGTEVLSNTRLRRGVEVAATVGFLVLFVASTLVIFNSPYIHRATQHVTDAKVTGYETTFDITDDEAVLAGVRQEPQRYYEATVSLDDNGLRDGTVNSSEIRRLQERQDRSWYLVISQNTYEREIGPYREYRYSSDDLESVSQQPRVNRVFSNGDTELYYIP